jgi:hypothetical protein
MNDQSYITVNKCGVSGRKRRLATLSPFFIGEVIYRVTDDQIIFTKPGLGYRGNTIKTRVTKIDKWCRFEITADIEPGQYVFDAESDEDTKIINLER